MPLAPGTRVGPYEVVALIGAGGMRACGRASERSESSLWRGGGFPTRCQSALAAFETVVKRDGS
jgi:hypothetical protein